ncbi:MAG: hypothetical protein NTV57_05370 [Cyanobacteria bacterium]|nr:hypothetical protein [Cyanobacteriota bacterium]
MRGVYASGNSVYVATAGGLSVSTNGGTSYTNYTTADGLGNNFVRGVYASGNTIYTATYGGVSLAQLPVPGPIPVMGAGAAFGWSRRLRRRLRHNTCAVVPPTP